MQLQKRGHLFTFTGNARQVRIHPQFPENQYSIWRHDFGTELIELGEPPKKINSISRMRDVQFAPSLDDASVLLGCSETFQNTPALVFSPLDGSDEIVHELPKDKQQTFASLVRLAQCGPSHFITAVGYSGDHQGAVRFFRTNHRYQQLEDIAGIDISPGEIRDFAFSPSFHDDGIFVLSYESHSDIEKNDDGGGSYTLSPHTTVYQISDSGKIITLASAPITGSRFARNPLELSPHFQQDHTVLLNHSGFYGLQLQKNQLVETFDRSPTEGRYAREGLVVIPGNNEEYFLVSSEIFWPDGAGPSEPIRNYLTVDRVRGTNRERTLEEEVDLSPEIGALVGTTSKRGLFFLAHKAEERTIPREMQIEVYELEF